MGERHLILVVEDNPENAAVLVDLVRSMDFDVRLVTTLAEAKIALAECDPCALLQDVQIPHAAGARPHESAGKSSVRLARAKSAGPSRMVIIAVTAFRNDPTFVMEMVELEVDWFVSKSEIERLPERLLACLKKNGREDHAWCAACNRESAPAGGVGKGDGKVVGMAVAVGLVIDGVKKGRRTGFLVRGERRDLQDGKFVPFLRLVVAHLRERGSWVSGTALGVTRDKWIPSRIRAAFKEAVPEGFEVVEGDRSGRFRLNPAVEVERVDWEVLEGHSEVAVVKMAKEQRGR